MKYFVIILIFFSITSCTFQKIPRNKILSVNNLEDFFCQDYSRNLSYLTAHDVNTEQKLKSISIYRYSSSYQTFLLEDSIIFNKGGKPVLKFRRSDVNAYCRSYLFYDNHGNGYLDLTIGSNNYDTTYVLRKFDKYNRIRKEISYNATRKEYEKISVTDIDPISDSLINIKYEFYESNLKDRTLLPFETREISVRVLNDSLVQTTTNRIVQNDTVYNSSNSSLFKIDNNVLIPIDEKAIINRKVGSGCLEMRYNQCYIKRKIDFYDLGEKEMANEFSIKQSIVQNLNVKIDSLPIVAWEQHRKNLHAFSERNKILEAGANSDEIELNESLTIENFTPKLWHIVSQDSGHVNGIKNICHVVGYNTPIKNENDFNKRCLAVYEKKDGKFIVVKKSFGALEDFNDSNRDLLFDDWDESNFSVEIEDGKVVVNYNYMQGGASYVFAHEDGTWVLVYYASNHRTCCQAESYSYDYATKKYSFSVFNIGEEAKGDTTYTLVQKRPVMYMDSMNIRTFDYNETGLIVK